ncbi:endoglucanase-like, partial [Littorina saxatilis]|uniref:endoglucanase-like n=1 Tax=Littorina saxatilis TaxID=31220 RepID=UPI0038B4DD30
HSSLFSSVIFPAPVLLKAEPKCQPDAQGVRRFLGKPCASTTRYDDGLKGSCGCGPVGKELPFDWGVQEMTAAASQMYFDNGGNATWCGARCGRCIKLTPTGGFLPVEAGPPPNNHPQIFILVDDCPVEAPNTKWCGIAGPPGTNKTNSFGYEVHFDLMDHVGQVTKLGWDNPEVVWEEVNCPAHLHSLSSQCECVGTGK